VLDPGSGNDPGTGTATLVVTGGASARARLTNAQTPGDFDTDFSVRITLNGQTITTGTVTMTSTSGKLPLVFNLVGTGNGSRWEGTAPTYDEVYVLDVDNGADNVHGVRVDGPDIHWFTAPTAGATVDSTMPLPVTWDRASASSSASIHAENLNDVAITDTGSYSLAPGALKAEKDRTRVNTVQLTRTNRVTPAGAAAGSELAVSIENDIDVVAQANPAL
jgi:hypothetical protein